MTAGMLYVLPLMAAKGITGIRDMGTNLPFDEIQQVRRDVYAGRIVGPRVEAWTGAIIDGAESTLPSGTRAATQEQARALVRWYKAAGATFIKPYDLLSPEIYRALVDEARLHNLPVAGHVPWAMSTAAVSELGQRSLEHGFDLLVSLSTEELALREQARTEGRTAPHVARSRTELRAIDTYDTRKADELFARFVRNGTWQCPTIINLRWTAIADVAELTGDARQRYLPPMLRQEWAATLERGLPSLGTLEDRTKRFEARVKITGAMYRAGVRLLAGTDSHNPFNYPGWSLHEELEMFVRAGLTPAEALRTATIGAAEFLGRENDFGTIDRGKVADLVLLDENPIENIGHSQKIHGVVLNGRYLDRSKLAAMLEETAASVLTFKRRQ